MPSSHGRLGQRALVALAFAVGACGSPSRLNLIVCGDVFVPGDIDLLTLTVSGRSGADQRTLSPGALPVGWTIEAGEQVHGPVVLTLDGIGAGQQRLRQAVRADFAEGETVEVGIFLARGCLDVSCRMSTGCGPSGSCESPPAATSSCCSPSPCDPAAAGTCGPDAQCEEIAPLDFHCCQ